MERRDNIKGSILKEIKPGNNLELKQKNNHV